MLAQVRAHSSSGGSAESERRHDIGIGRRNHLPQWSVSLSSKLRRAPGVGLLVENGACRQAPWQLQAQFLAGKFNGNGKADTGCALKNCCVDANDGAIFTD